MDLLEFGHPRSALRGQLTWFMAWAGVTIVGAILKPSASGHGTHEELGLPPCPSVLIFDRPCPGCGLTTSWTAFIHGHFSEAFHAHPLGPILYVLFGLSALLGLYGFIRGARLVTETPQMNRALTAVVVVFLTFGLIRMAVTPNYGTQGERILAKFSR